MENDDEYKIIQAISHGTKTFKRVGDYIIIKTLGKGGQALVFLAKKVALKPGDEMKDFALKKFSKADAKDKSSLTYVKAEVAVMRKIDHVNILKSYEILETENNFYLVLEYCNKGNFNNYIKNRKLNEKEAVFYFKQIINGLYELRTHRILHRDIKLENLLVHDDIIKIADFGFAVSDDFGKEYLGTLTHMAPEILFFPRDRIKYDYKADLWSTGVAFFEMLNGYLPFQKRTKAEIQKEIESYSGKNLRFASGLSTEAMNLLEGLLTIETSKRFSWDQFYNHPLFQKYGEIRTESVIVSAIHKSFEANRKKVNTGFDLEYMDMNEFLKMANEQSVSIQAKRVEEKAVADNFTKKLVLADCLKEIQNRYLHEANKISFLLATAKDIYNFVAEDNFKQANFNLLNSCLLLLKKALVQNLTMLKNLNMCRNKLNLNKELFDFINKILFKESMVADKIEDIKKAFQINTQIEHYMEDVIKLSNQKKICLFYKDLYEKDNPTEWIINTAISSEYQELLHYLNKIELKTNEEKKKRFLLIILFIYYSIFLEKKFPYFEDPKAFTKFNLMRFYFEHEKMDSKQLMAELDFSKSVLASELSEK